LLSQIQKQGLDHAITIPIKENNRSMCNQSKTFSYSWMLKIKEKWKKWILIIAKKIQWILLYN
jgi:hypothetical protein